MGCCASIDTNDHPLPKKRSTLEENKAIVQDGSRANSAVDQSKTLQEKQSKVPKLDLTKAVSNAANSNAPKKVASALKTDTNQENPEQTGVVNNPNPVKPENTPVKKTVGCYTSTSSTNNYCCYTGAYPIC